ncbi:ABC transporter ATP-binding protein [Natronosporangium hydrolyticum]|uniref:ABC transporter ATP-binding protein n=1 Tax=Natronosporangium hydrolyticum TaxID=2811111 RepID=A0A895Y9E6_9ACTN|nr:ABC transporter ATP-binding protein [Natronosporangium hydrolyticum]QSB13941.1 ABC transporter ATP-binding protein [Natronosporangium hydrolyticum]
MTAIEVCNLTKRYGDTVAARDISFTVEQGEIFGILGPNGAGKTTTVECVVGLRTADAGSINVLGLDPVRQRAALRHEVGVQLQESRLPDKIRVDEAVALFRTFYRRPADGDQLLSLLGLTDKRRTQYRHLSGGQKQRLSVALALVGSPRVAVLDELTTGLDPQARRDTWELIEQVRDTGVTIILVTHFMDEAERLCDRLALIDGGQVVALDTPAGLVAQAGKEQRVRFRPARPFDDALLTELPEVSMVRRQGEQVTVSGTGNLLHTVTAALARQQIIAQDLRVDQVSLDDAFVALTGRSLES